MVPRLLLHGMLAGSLAGLLAFGIASLVGEPQLELALGFEAAQHEAGHMMDVELVSRATQRGLGLLTACVAVGVALGGVLALVFAATYQRVGRMNATTLAVLLASVGFVTLVLVPQLKYPANPPSVGSDETIGLRTALYFEMVLIAVAAMVLAWLLGRMLIVRLGGPAAFLIGAVAFMCLVVALQAALPGINEVPDSFPTAVLWRFRLASLGTQFALWAGLGAIFGLLARRSLQA